MVSWSARRPKKGSMKHGDSFTVTKFALIPRLADNRRWYWLENLDFTYTLYPNDCYVAGCRTNGTHMHVKVFPVSWRAVKPIVEGARV